MADDVTKKILIDVQLKQTQLKTDIKGLNTDLDALLVKQIKLSAANKQNTTEYIGLTSQIRLTRAEIREANKQVDNMTKALNAENNSITQNRALLSVLTAQYTKLSLEEGKTAKSTTDLGITIKNLSTTLKAQEKQIGQTYREVGNYEEAFTKALNTVSQFVPGLQKFNTAITTAVKGFGFLPNSMAKTEQATAKLNQGIGYMPQNLNNAAVASENLAVKGEEVAASQVAVAEAAPAAEAGVAGITGAMVGLIAATIGVILVISAVIGFMAKLTPNAEALARTWSGLGGIWRQFMSDLADDTDQTWTEFISKMAVAYKASKDLTQGFQDLARETQILAANNADADEKIADIQLKMRNRRITPEQEQAYFNQIQQISNESYKQRKDVADKEYNLAVRAATIGRNFTDDELKQLKQKGVAYAAYLDKLKGLANKEGAGTDVAAISKAEQDQAAAERFKQTTQDRAQNRLDARQMKAEQAAEKERSLLESIAEKTKEANSERMASITRMLEFQQDAFGKEISATNEHYRQLIFKQEEFIAKQQFIASDPKSSPKVRAAANNAVSAGKSDIKQLQSEQYIATEKLLVDHNRTMIAEAAKGALELKAIQIAGMKDLQKAEIAQANNELDQKKLQLNDEQQTIEDNLRKINEELAADAQKKSTDKTKYTDNEIQALKTTLNAQLALLADNDDKRIALIQQTNDKINEINRQFYNQELANQDKTSIIQAQQKPGITGGKNNPFNSAEQSAKHQQLLDEYNAEVSNQSLTNSAKLEMEQAYLAADKDLTEQNEKDKMAVALQYAQVAQNAVFSIISNSIKSQAQATEVQLAKSKDHELANTSLTSAQKLAIDDKYRKLEGQEKVKEFKADQKLSLAKAAIETAESILKASPIIPLMALAAATGAAEIAVIASQKPPAYATGGQFVSDGKGSVLPGYSRRDNVNATLRSGEAVVVSEAMRNPYARNLVSAVNVAFGGKDFSVPNSTRGFAIGGIVTDGGDSNRYYAAPQEGSENLANNIAYSLINNFPPVFVDVKDINNQQGIKTKTINRVNL